MTVNRDFTLFLGNLQIKNSDTISGRYGSITRSLNLYFRDSDSRTNFSIQAGSYGRHSGINGISDLDMLYIIPPAYWDTYKNDPARLIDHCKTEISKTYPNTSIKRDRNVVVVSFQDFVIEVVPVFEWKGKFKYPDTYNGGKWRTCDTRAELQSFKDKNNERNRNLRRLAKMIRTWKIRNDISMSGFLIDTLCYRFLQNNTTFDKSSYGSYDLMVRDFFMFLANEPQKTFYLAMGSNSQVNVSKPFQKEAQTALENAKAAIDARAKGYDAKCNQHYKSLFGTKFPNREVNEIKARNEEFIEEMFPMDLTHTIKIDCNVRDDMVTKLLSVLNVGGNRIQHHRKLNFFIKNSNIVGSYEVKWKVLNQGYVADRNDNHRGQILNDDGSKTRNETATFYGDHIVECYAIRDNTVIARDRITVPIS